MLGAKINHTMAAELAELNPECSLSKIGTLTLRDKKEGNDWYPGVMCLPEKKLLLVDCSVNTVKVYDRETGDLLTESERMKSRPWDVCTYDHSMLEVAVALGNGTIEILSIQSTISSVVIASVRTVQTPLKVCHAVRATTVKNRLIVSGRSTDGMLCWCLISILDRNVESINTICKYGSLGSCYMDINTETSTVYFSCAAGPKSDKTGVYGYDIEIGRCRVKYHQKDLRWPKGICLDTTGYIYVCNVHPPCIHQLTEHGQRLQVFKEDMPSLPRAICLDENKDLLITCWKSKDLSRFRIVRNKHGPIIPIEILRMDEKSLQLYKEALRDGKEKVYNIRVMVVGQFGVGKTTLTKRLLGKKVDVSIRNSTEGIDVYKHCCKIPLDTRKWIVQSEDAEQLSRLQRLVKHLTCQIEKSEVTSERTEHKEVIYQREKCLIHSDSSDEEDDDIKTDSESDIEQNVDKNSSQSEKLSVVKDKRKQVTSKGDATIEFLRLVNENADKLNTSIVAHAVLAMWDFAGQYVFYTTHQTFLTCRAIYILVTDLSKGITDPVTDDECYFDTDGVKLYRVQDLAEVWLNSIHCCTPCLTSGTAITSSSATTPVGGTAELSLKPDTTVATPKPSSAVGDACTLHGTSTTSTTVTSPNIAPTLTPPVILVGTHADKLQEGKRDEFTKTYWRQICRFLKDKPTLHHLVGFFAIDNTNVDPQLEKLKDKIFQLASEQPYWGEEVPTCWLPMEQALMKLKAIGKKVITLKLVEDLNQAASVPIKTAEQLDLFLRCQHEMGTIIYFSVEELKHKIVLDPQWLINAQKSLINAEHLILTHFPNISDKWFEFKENGKLTPELMDAVWSTNEEFQEEKEYIVHLMEKLNIIAMPRSYVEGTEELKQEEYYLAPCMLRQETPKDIISPESGTQMESTSILCFVATGKFMPPPVFHRLIAACVAHWPIATQNEKTQIYCGCCIFDLDHHHRLTVHFRDYIICARVTRMGGPDIYLSSKLCTKARIFMIENLTKITGTLGHNLQYEEHIKCPHSDADSTKGLLPVSLLKKNRNVPCHFHDKSHVLVSNELLKFWFEVEEKASDVNPSDIPEPGRWEIEDRFGMTDTVVSATPEEQSNSWQFPTCNSELEYLISERQESEVPRIYLTAVGQAITRGDHVYIKQYLERHGCEHEDDLRYYLDYSLGFYDSSGTKSMANVFLSWICKELTKLHEPHKVSVWAATPAREGRINEQPVLVCNYWGNVDVKCQQRFFGLLVKYQEYNTVNSEEQGVQSSKIFCENKLSTKDAILANEIISLNTDRLMKLHSNLEVIKPCPVRSTRSKVTKETCIVLSCRLKGFIPFEESLFPKYLRAGEISLPVDVREDFYVPAMMQEVQWDSQLFRMGFSMGPYDHHVSATVGPFVQMEGGNVGFLTCAHVFGVPCNVETSLKKRVVQPANGDFAPVHGAHAGGNDEAICGYIDRIRFDVELSHPVNIDAALVRLEHGKKPVLGRFAWMNQFSLDEAGLKYGEFLKFDDGEILTKRMFQEHVSLTKGKLIKFGARSGVTSTLSCLTPGLAVVKIGGDAELVFDQGYPFPPVINGTRCFVMKGQYLIQSKSSTNFLIAGDSGSGVFHMDENQKLRCIGIAIGFLAGSKEAVVTPIEDILKALGLKEDALMKFIV